MKNKNILRLISIILIVVGVFCIALAFVGNNKEYDNNEVNNNTNNNNNNNNNGDVEPPAIEEPIFTYDFVYSMALSLYGGEDVNIELEEETDRFIIKRIYKDSGAVERYFVDKETGSIFSEEIVADDEIVVDDEIVSES